MPVFHAAAVAARRFLVRRPWVYWAFVAVAVGGAVASVVDHSAEIDDARDAWGATADVWVAIVDHEPGDPIRSERVTVPVAVVAESALDAAPPDEAIARQRIAAGSMLHDVDVAATAGPQTLTPPGSLAVPVVESPPSGALVGDRVQVVADGIVVADDATVVGHHDDATLVAVPAADAALLPAAADAGRVTLLLVP